MLVDGLAGGEVDGGEIPGAGVGGPFGFRVGVDEPAREGQLGDERGDAFFGVGPDGAAALGVEIDAGEAGLGGFPVFGGLQAFVAEVILDHDGGVRSDERVPGGVGAGLKDGHGAEEAIAGYGFCAAKDEDVHVRLGVAGDGDVIGAHEGRT